MSDNPNAFKLWINEALLRKIASAIRAVHPDFDSRSFLRVAPKLDALELKPRVHLVRDALREHLPEDYPTALKILLRSIVDSSEGKSLSGFDLWPYTEFVQAYGLDHERRSLYALSALTRRFTAEFAVRPFLARDPEGVLEFLLKMASSENEHERRWASEGSRSRLPWGLRLNVFIEKPRMTLPILERLRFDEAIYVRKSVANHLNDLSKDNPGVVLETLRKWLKGTPKEHRAKIEWITKQALRGLIKAGDAKALALIGAKPAEVVVSDFTVSRKRFREGEKVEFSLRIRSRSKKAQKLVVDYAIHYRKANGGISPKVFKLKTFTLAAGESVEVVKSHVLRRVTTRKHYTGEHFVEVQVNGRSVGKLAWMLAL